MAHIQVGSYLILLGKHQQLAFGELQSLIPQSMLLDDNFTLTSDGTTPVDIFDRLGGSVKLYQVVAITSSDTLVQDVVASVTAHPTSQIAFSHYHINVSLKQIAGEAKETLSEQGIKLRFRLLDSIYSSAGIGDEWTELCIARFQDVTYLLKTVKVQNIEYWSFKDYDRPGFDARSGMMPPKVGRMLINLALPLTQADSSKIVYDPFCGSGTLLVEGLDAGYSVIGSDVSAKAVADATSNCDWFTRQVIVPGTYRVFQKDATHLTLEDVPQVDAIAFEGYLGPPNPQEARFSNLIKGMGKLYKGVFKTLYPILKEDGYLVCALPEYHSAQGVKNLDKLIDSIQTLGYTRCTRFTYGRPQAVVKRSIYVLKKSSK